MKSGNPRFKNRTNLLGSTRPSLVLIIALGRDCPGAGFWMTRVCGFSLMRGPGGDNQGRGSRQIQPNIFWTFPSENPTPMDNRVRYAFGSKKAEKIA